ncbi:MAG: hypothetical protein M1839_009067 [Geoglossum umbratile]|nr:MAG: hypothetical protein M1839_009067 [Geoglossum umbratile]
MGALPLGSLREQPDEEALTPLTPETKRRRFNSSLPTPNANGPITRSIASRMEGSASRSPYPMDPPPRPHSGTIVGPPNKTPGSLPPLQTTPIDSVKAMVMTIPFINKIKVISRISPPLSPPGPLSPPHQIRGTIIAIDGNDTATTEKLFRWLEQALRKTGEYAIRSFEAPLNHFERCDRPAAGRGDSEFFVEYLGEVLAWHRRTGEIIRHVTQLPAGGGGGGGERVSQPPPTTTTPSSSSSSSQPHPHPISLLPHYILTRSNTAASHIPINDRYAPVDHWQWMATLWRGCVGPDFTVYARADCPPDEFAKCPAVEMRPDAAAVVVRSLRGAATVWEDRVLRRLGFEVGEWVKGGEGWGGVR